jgi:hypothetical protein
MAINYIFSYPISNHPQASAITRTMTFIRFNLFDLDGIHAITAEFKLNHFALDYTGGTYSLESLNKNIQFFINDQGGLTNPIDLDIDVQGNLVGMDSELVDDIDFAVNWFGSNKGMLTFFQLAILKFDQKIYAIDGTPCDTINNLSPIYSLIDLKYFGIVP